jgi:hypothetical protein
MDITRRDFARTALGGATLFALADAVFGRTDLFAAPIRPVVNHWLADLDAVGREVKTGALQQVEWQKKVEDLYSRVDLKDFLAMMDFEAFKKKLDSFNGKGALSLGVNFKPVEGVPAKFIFGRQVFAMKKGKSIVPHGHDSMATAFLVLSGTCRGRHYDRVADEKEHMIIVPTIDKEFEPGGASSISDKKDNVHWFEALTDSAFVFNIHVMGLPGNPKNPGRVYLDPGGEKIEGGKIRARLIDHDEATKLYG